MAEWKETGFVPDSDDEEDLLDLRCDLDTPDPAAHGNNKDTPTLGGEVDWNVPDSPKKVATTVEPAFLRETPSGAFYGSHGEVKQDEVRLQDPESREDGNNEDLIGPKPLSSQIPQDAPPVQDDLADERALPIPQTPADLGHDIPDDEGRDVERLQEQENQEDVNNEDEIFGPGPSSSQVPQEPRPLQEYQAESSIARLLQKELDCGLNLVKEVLNSPRPIAKPSQIFDPLGSPLGSPLSTVPNSPSRSAQSDGEDRAPLPSIITTDDFEAAPGRRTFRARKPIQQHPYLLEDARYKLDMMSRGLKPLSTAAHTQPRLEGTAATQDDARQGDANDEFIAPSSPQRPSKHLKSSTGLPGKEGPNQDELMSSQASDSSSDIFNIPHEREALRSSSHIRSRLKPVHVARKSIHPQIEVRVDPYQARVDKDQPVKYGPSSTPDHRLPAPTRYLSPVGSLSDESDVAGPRAPIDSTPPTFVTPGTSSAIHFLSDRDHISGETITLDSRFSLDSSSQELPDLGQDRQDDEILKFQRRTRGTLPASFMRLQNQSGRQAQKSKERPVLSPSQPAQGPGVAIRVARAHGSGDPVSRFDSIFSLSEESTSEDDAQRSDVRPSALPRAASWSPQDLIMDDGEIEEDNRVEAMAPPATRRRRKSGSNKRQRRISGYGGLPRSLTQHEGSHVQKPKRRRREPTRGKLGRSRRPAKSGVRVLDAPGFQVLARAQQPSFLRVAARQARSAKRRVNLSPSQKIIRLATLADTREAEQELRTWQVSLATRDDQARGQDPGRPSSGRATDGSKVSNSQYRGPLATGRPMQSYYKPSQAALNPGHVQSHGLNATEETIQRILRRQQGISEPEVQLPAPTAALPVNEPSPTAPQPLDRLRAAHSNRSGSGFMLSSTNEFARQRQALLERHFPPRQPHKPRQSDYQDYPIQGRPVPSALPSPPTTVEDFSSASPTATKAPSNSNQGYQRKRAPQAVDVKALDTAWETGSLRGSDADDVVLEQPLSGVVLLGLGSPEFPMSTDFGVKPFAEGTQLGGESAISTGLLLKSIQGFVKSPRNLMEECNETPSIARLATNAPAYSWGSWDNKVANDLSNWITDLKTLIATLCSAESSSSSHHPAMRSLVNYVSTQIWFTSEESVTNFAQTLVGLLTDISFHFDCARWEPSALAAHMGISSFLLILTFSVIRIAPLQSIDKDIEASALKTFNAIALNSLTAVFRDYFRGDASNRQASSDMAPGQDDVKIEVVVVISNLANHIPQVDFWKLAETALQSVVGTAPESLTTFSNYDRWWQGILVLLPALEIDASGTAIHKSGPTGWILVQRLLERFLSIFLDRRHSTGYSTKTYGRMLLFRCLRLVETWGWQGGHSVIGLLYEAFNRNQLQDIFGGMSSAKFSLTRRLYPGQSVSVEVNDSGFHILLSIVSSAIHDCFRPGADPRLASRVLRSLNTRLAPQQGREFSRFKTPTWSQLTSLRNSFDLGAVMFCMMPSDMNAMIEPLKSVVNFRSADRQTCKAALECWSELVQYMNLPRVVSEKATLPSTLSICESLLALKGWHSQMSTDLLIGFDLIEQGSLEVTEQQESHRNEARLILSDRRRPFLHVLTDTLKALREAFNFCPTPNQAIALFEPTQIEKVLQLFDPCDFQRSAVISEALGVVSDYALKCVPKPVLLGSEDDDSQQYGSWDHYDELMDIEGDEEAKNPGVESLLSDVVPGLSRFVTAIFGSDTGPDPTLLKITCETWFTVAKALVRAKVKGWEDFVEPYSSTSWESLRPTQQTQQYQPYFMSLIVEHDAGFYERHRLLFLGVWLCSLCRPKSLLRWGHVLTSAILFHDPDNELLFNTPFVVRQEDGERCSLSAFEVHDRRNSLMYTILRNMNRMVAAPAPKSQTPFTCGKTDLSSLLKKMESTIHSSYLDLEEGSSAQIEYRDFLGYFVQQEQLYAAGFHKIDPFLLDPAISSAESRQVFTTFKRYGLTIRRTGVTKPMILFLYHVSQKAAVDDTQDHLTTELQDAFLDLRQEAIEAEDNYGNDVAMLALFCKHVFPAYLEDGFNEPADFVALPILRLLRHVFTNLRCREDFWTPTVMQEVVSGAESVLKAVMLAMQSFSPFLKMPDIQTECVCEAIRLCQAVMLRAYEAYEAFPEEIDYAEIFDVLLTARDWLWVDCIEILGLSMEGFQRPSTDQEPNRRHNSPPESSIGVYARRELENQLQHSWQPRMEDTCYEIVDKGQRKRVPVTKPFRSHFTVSPQPFVQPAARIESAIGNFFEAFDSLDCWD